MKSAVVQIIQPDPKHETAIQKKDGLFSTLNHYALKVHRLLMD